MKVVKFFLNLMLAFLLIFSIVGTIAMNLVSKTILDKQYFLSKLDETEFYIQLEREAKNEFENYIYQSGLPIELFDQIYDEDMIKKDINSVINYIYDGTPVETSEEVIKKNLEDKISGYASENKIPMTNENNKNVENFKTLIVETYKNTVRISDSAVNRVKNLIGLTDKIYEKFKIIPFISLIAIIILVVLINIKSVGSIINTIAIPLLSTGILFKLFEWIIVKNINIDDLLILSYSISSLLISILKELIYSISNYGTVFIILGATGIIIGSMINTSKKTEKVFTKTEK